MYFLGQASTYKLGDVLRHTFSFGTKSNLNELRAYLAAHYGTTKDRVAVYHSGRTGLAIALDRLVPKESEVIVTALTCYAVYEAISEAGCVPVFADIDKDVIHFGPKELKTALALHPDARAVVVQNNLGIPCDIRGIEKICKKYGLVLIEDLAHSMGIHYRDGREAGTVGDAVVLSFGKGKAIDTITGGAVIFTSPDSPTISQPSRRPRLSDRLRDRWYPFFGLLIRGFYHIGNLGRLFTSFLLKIHFIQRSADTELEPLDRITFWQAKLALRQIKKLPRSGRKPIREPFFVEDREYLLKELERGGYVFDDIWYSCPVSPVRYYRRVNFPEEECPMAVWAAEHLVNLPTWYSKKDLKPAKKLLGRYEVKEEDIPNLSVELTPKTPVKAPKEVKKEPAEEYYNEKYYNEEYYEEGAIDEAIEELEAEPAEKSAQRSHVIEAGGNINYSEVVYDKLDKKHLNRTNIIDKNTNSDGTSVTLTRKERFPKKPTTDNLPKIRQYKRPEKGPETTEGKVW